MTGAGDIAAALRPPHLPAADVLPDLLLAAAGGLLLALLLALLIGFVTHRPPRTHRLLLAELEATRGLPAAERGLALAKLLQRLSPEGVAAVPGLADALYRPEAAIDFTAAERRVTQLARAASRQFNVGGRPEASRPSGKINLNGLRD